MQQPRSVAQNERLASVRAGIAGTSGEMVLVEYVGLKAGAESWTGRSTGQRYRFSSSLDDRQKYVFKDDAEYLLTLPGFRMVSRESTEPVVESDYKAAPQVATLVSKPLAMRQAPQDAGGLGTVGKAKADDLTAIRGISKRRAEWLDSIGITTFEDLLSMPPNDLLGAATAASVKGLTLAMIDGWRVQAGELATE